MVSSTTTTYVVAIAMFLMILFVIANLAKVVSYFRRTMERRAQAKNGPQKPVTPSEALARATQSSNPKSRIAISLLTLRASLPGCATSPAPEAEENPSSTVNIDEAPVLSVSEYEELPVYARGFEVAGQNVWRSSPQNRRQPPSYLLSDLEHGQ